MTFDDIFEAYYTQYRLEADTPASTEDEYVIAVRLANEAINRWANYDNTYWKELFSTLLIDSETITLTAAKTYDLPAETREVGSHIRILDSDDRIVRKIRLIEPHRAQFYSESTSYAFVTGNVTTGLVLNINPAPDTAIQGLRIDLDYYKKPTLFKQTGTSTATGHTEMSQPYFIVHRMLANRFRGSRNPYYGSAKNDAEDVLKTMKLENDTGTWVNPFSLPDNSGSVFGE